ncbi:SRPBCC family protein [Haloarculaceae archaeon H-GB2-1]|nr:SRPBCC family protein [Haloarculaceae archaeon H-GB1-1]MEA5385725.1 SRPBCC family protein [Haloarculaceae archaeon H-GB11]MEA5407226.1 SRPBCC family protein [Haloarculaceae archaeon H-GB2-1]
MREVEATTFVTETPAELERRLTPAAVLEYEGTFEVTDVTETDDGWTVTGEMAGVEVEFDFEKRPDGYHYEQRGEDGPFEHMETDVTLTPLNEGTRVTMRSAVSMALPLSSVTDRVAAWKRRGELQRALDALEADVS